MAEPGVAMNTAAVEAGVVSTLPDAPAVAKLPVLIVVWAVAAAAMVVRTAPMQLPNMLCKMACSLN
jgi:hypothetical protein